MLRNQVAVVQWYRATDLDDPFDSTDILHLFRKYNTVPYTQTIRTELGTTMPPLRVGC